MAAQSFNDLDALGDRRAEMARARHQVALVQIVGPHAHLDQLVHELALDVDAIVDAGQQHGLIAQGNARVGQHAARAAQLWRDLVRMVDVNVHPQGMILAEHRAQLFCDALRHKHRHTRADADDLDVRDGPQSRQQVIQHLGRQRERIAAGKHHVADLGRARDVINLRVVLGQRELRRRVADDPAACAIAAVRSALRRHQHQHAIRVTMHQSRHGAVQVFGQRVLHHGLERNQLLRPRNHLQPNRVMRIVRVHQRRKVGCDVHTEKVVRLERLDFLIEQPNHLRQFL